MYGLIWHGSDVSNTQLTSQVSFYMPFHVKCLGWSGQHVRTPKFFLGLTWYYINHNFQSYLLCCQGIICFFFSIWSCEIKSFLIFACSACNDQQLMPFLYLLMNHEIVLLLGHRTASTTRLRMARPTWTPYFLEPQDIGETLQAAGLHEVKLHVCTKPEEAEASAVDIASIISTISAPPSDRQIWLLSCQHSALSNHDAVLCFLLCPGEKRGILSLMH